MMIIMLTMMMLKTMLQLQPERFERGKYPLSWMEIRAYGEAIITAGANETT